jgi:hypothetical protein
MVYNGKDKKTYRGATPFMHTCCGVQTRQGTRPHKTAGNVIL